LGGAVAVDMINDAGVRGGGTRTRINTNPYGAEAIALGRNEWACGAQKVN